MKRHRYADTLRRCTLVLTIASGCIALAEPDGRAASVDPPSEEADPGALSVDRIEILRVEGIFREGGGYSERSIARLGEMAERETALGALAACALVEVLLHTARDRTDRDGAVSRALGAAFQHPAARALSDAVWDRLYRHLARGAPESHAVRRAIREHSASFAAHALERMDRTHTLEEIRAFLPLLGAMRYTEGLEPHHRLIKGNLGMKLEMLERQQEDAQAQDAHWQLSREIYDAWSRDPRTLEGEDLFGMRTLWSSDPGRDPLDAVGERTVVLLFWATWCDDSVEAMRRLHMIGDRYQGSPVDIVLVSYRRDVHMTPGGEVVRIDPDDDGHEHRLAARFLEQTGIPWDAVFVEDERPDGDIVDVTPLLMVVDHEGKIAIGAVRLHERLDAVFAWIDYDLWRQGHEVPDI